MLSCVTLFTRCKICLKPLLCLRPCAVGGTGVRASIGEGSEGRLSGMYLRSVLFLYPFRNKGAKIHQLTPTIMLRLDPPKLTKSCSADPVSAKRSIAVAFAYNTGTEQMGFPILRGVITFFKCSAPVFSIVWFTRGSIDTSAARGCAAEFGCTSHAVPTERLFSRLAKCGAPFGSGRFRRAAVHGGASDFSNRRTAALVYSSVPCLRRTPIVPAANDHSPSGTGMTGITPENPVSETVLRPMNPDFTSVLTASQNANGCAGRIVSRGRNPHAAARRPRRIRGAFEEPNHLAPHEDRPSATEASPSNDRMRLSSIFHRIVADNDTQSLNLEVTPFISGVSSATSCFEFEDKKNGRIGRPSMQVGTHVCPMPFSGAVLSCLFHTTASNEESPSVRRPDESANACEAVVWHGTDLGTSTLSGSRRIPRSTPPGSVPSSDGRSPNRRGGMARYP